MSVYFSGCEKDEGGISGKEDLLSIRSVPNEQPTDEEIASAKQLFYLKINSLSTGNNSDSLLHIWNEILPVWDEGKVLVLGGVRVSFIPTTNGMDKSHIQLVYFEPDKNEKYINIIGFWEDSPNQSSTSFSGKIFMLSENGNIHKITKIENSKVVGYFVPQVSINGIEQNGDSLELRDDADDYITQWACAILQCGKRGTDCHCYHYKTHGVEIKRNRYESFDHGVVYPPFVEETVTIGQWIYIFCDGDDCHSLWDDTDGVDIIDGDGSGYENLDNIGNHDNNNNSGNGSSGGGNAGDLDNDLTDIIAILLDGINPNYKPCDKDKDFDGYQPFAAQTMDYDDYLNLQADAIISMWGNNAGISLVNAILSSNGNLAGAIYNQVNPNNNFKYDEDNPIHSAVKKAIQALVLNINNSNGDCSSIMSMQDFINMLNNLLDKERKDLCTDNLETVETKYNLQLSQAEKDNILQNINVPCGEDDQDEFDKEVLEYLGLAGQDWFYDEDFWNDPDLHFDHQELPSWQDFYDAFPKYEDGRYITGSENIYKLVGGDVWQLKLNNPDDVVNTCALKVSIALNGAGINIPFIETHDGKYGTIEGKDGKYYFLNARSLKDWMVLTFGTDETFYKAFSEDDIGSNQTVGELLNHDHGIIFSMFEDSGASGHADIFDGYGCPFECYFGKDNHFWKLK